MDNPYVATGDEYLAHHGIKGQKWGVRRTPEELGYKTNPNRKKKVSQGKLEQLRKEQAEKSAQKKAQKSLEDKENLKAYLRKHPNKMYKHRTELSENDVNEIMKKVEFDRKLKDIRTEETKRTFDKINNIQQNAKTISDLLNTSINLYNNTATIYNGIAKIQERNGADMSNFKPMPAFNNGGGGGAAKLKKK